MASEYLKWKYRDIKPDQPVEHTKKQKAANWWHYHRWWLLAGVVLLPRVAGVAVVLPLRVAVVVPRCVVLEVRVAGVETFLSS